MRAIRIFDPSVAGPRDRTLPVLLALLLCLLAARGAAPRGAEAASIFGHDAFTRELLADLGWTDAEAIDRVAACNVCTDLVRPRLLTRELARFAFPRTSLRMPDVLALASTAPFASRGTVGFHFNSLYTFSEIEARWEALGAWVDATRVRLEAFPPGPDRRRREECFLGIVLHAVHDFYVHANWVEILDRSIPGHRDPSRFPIWEELTADLGNWRERHPEGRWREALHRMRISDRMRERHPELGGLQTGRVLFEPILGDTVPWRHRHPGPGERPVVESLVRRACRLWAERTGVAPARD